LGRSTTTSTSSGIAQEYVTMTMTDDSYNPTREKRKKMFLYIRAGIIVMYRHRHVVRSGSGSMETALTSKAKKHLRCAANELALTLPISGSQVNYFLTRAVDVMHNAVKLKARGCINEGPVRLLEHVVRLHAKRTVTGP